MYAWSLSAAATGSLLLTSSRSNCRSVCIVRRDACGPPELVSFNRSVSGLRGVERSSTYLVAVQEQHSKTTSRPGASQCFGRRAISPPVEREGNELPSGTVIKRRASGSGDWNCLIGTRPALDKTPGALPRGAAGVAASRHRPHEWHK